MRKPLTEKQKISSQRNRGIAKIRRFTLKGHGLTKEERVIAVQIKSLLAELEKTWTENTLKLTGTIAQ